MLGIVSQVRMILSLVDERLDAPERSLNHGLADEVDNLAHQRPAPRSRVSVTSRRAAPISGSVRRLCSVTRIA